VIYVARFLVIVFGLAGCVSSGLVYVTKQGFNVFCKEGVAIREKM